MGKNFPAEGTDYRKNPAHIRPDVQRWIAGLKEAGVKRAFVSVQCENCHGPKPGHPFAADGAVKKVSSTVCLSCHTPEQMPAWYDAGGKVKQPVVDAALQSVACPR
jgi:predicted CXXCH cytochrome family protein